MTLLSVQNLRAYYRTEAYGISRTVRAVDGVSFDLFPNEIYGVAGEFELRQNHPDQSDLGKYQTSIKGS